MKQLLLKPINKFINAELTIPGSKSIANRILIIAAMAHGTSIIHNVPYESEDVALMLEAIKQLGIKTEVLNKNSFALTIKIYGCGGIIPNKETRVFCGNSGTTIRFLTAVLALQQGNYTLYGIERMHERPIADLVTALEQTYAQIEYLQNNGYPPILIKPFEQQNFSHIKVSGSTSSQFLTGLLISIALNKQEINDKLTHIEVIDQLISKPYIEITLGLLKKFDAQITVVDESFNIYPTKLQGIEYFIEPDASSASYFLALGAINGSIKIAGLSLTSLQGDKLFAKVLEQMGAKVIYHKDAIEVIKDKLNGIEINMEHMPDVAMTLATLALFAEGVTKITGIASWKVKETDRLSAMYCELTKLGAIVSISNESITIVPPSQINDGVTIATYNDHRMAMCFSLIAAVNKSITIENPNCVKKTFANYWEIFNQVCY